jgi:hypothetical protein
MRRLFALLLLTVSLVACDDLNRPMGHPKSPSLTPESSSSSSGGMPSSTDGGTPSPEAGPGTAPTVQPQPGDIQI